MSRKVTLVLVLVAICMALCSCSGNNDQGKDDYSQSQSKSRKNASVTEAPQEVTERFSENSKWGLKRGSSVVYEPIWDRINTYNIDKYTRVFMVSLNDKVGLLNDEGEFIIEPSDKYAMPTYGAYIADGHIAIPYTEDDYNMVYKKSKDGTQYRQYSWNGKKADLISLSKKEVVASIPSHFIVSLFDDYVVYATRATANRDAFNEKKFSGLSIYNISEQKTIYKNPTCVEVKYYPSVGFVASLDPGKFWGGTNDVFLSLQGKQIFKTETEYNYATINYIQGADLFVVEIDNDDKAQYGIEQWYGDTEPDHYYVYYERDGSPIKGVFQEDGFTHHGDKSAHLILNQNIECVDGRIVNIVYSTDASISKYILFDLKSREMIPLPGVIDVKGFHDGLCAVKNNENLWGYIDTSGKYVFDFIFDDAENFSKGKATAVYNFKQVTIISNGKILSE